MSAHQFLLISCPDLAFDPAPQLVTAIIWDELMIVSGALALVTDGNLQGESS